MSRFALPTMTFNRRNTKTPRPRIKTIYRFLIAPSCGVTPKLKSPSVAAANGIKPAHLHLVASNLHKHKHSKDSLNRLDFLDQCAERKGFILIVILIEFQFLTRRRVFQK